MIEIKKWFEILTFILPFFLQGCSSTNQTSSDSDTSGIETEAIEGYDRTLCFPLNYSVVNMSNTEDIKLLVKGQPDLLKDFFDTYMSEQMPSFDFTLVDEKCNYEIDVEELIFKEFNLQVEGPEVNVAMVHIDYIFKTALKDTLLFSEINKESIPPFEPTVFQDMCNELAVDVLTKIKRIVDAQNPE